MLDVYSVYPAIYTKCKRTVSVKYSSSIAKAGSTLCIRGFECYKILCSCIWTYCTNKWETAIPYRTYSQKCVDSDGCLTVWSFRVEVTEVRPVHDVAVPLNANAKVELSLYGPRSSKRDSRCGRILSSLETGHMCDVTSLMLSLRWKSFRYTSGGHQSRSEVFGKIDKTRTTDGNLKYFPVVLPAA